MVNEASQTSTDADKPAIEKPEVADKPAIGKPEVADKPAIGKPAEVAESPTTVVTAKVKDVQDAPIHVLAVDDSSIDRRIVERLLKNASYKVTAVDSGSKALEVLATVNNNVSMVITDYCMPGMTGHELLTQIKTSTTYNEIPVVIMSSENVPSRIEKCLEDGAEEFLMKPVRLTDIKRLKSYVQKLPMANSIEQASVKCKKGNLQQAVSRSREVKGGLD